MVFGQPHSISLSFRDSANGRFLFRQFSPAPCSPPLGGSDGSSAVRFTPAESRAGAKTGRPDVKRDVFATIHAAPAINQSGRGSCTAFITLLHERLTRPESGAHLRTALCGIAATFLITHYAFCPRPPQIRVGAEAAPHLSRFCTNALHARRAALICARRYAALPRRS